MILHIDIDCFFVSAHRINNPNLRNIPVAVGGRSNLSIFDTNNTKRKLSTIQGAFTSSILSSTDHINSYEYFVDQDKRIRGIITTASYEARAYGVKTAISASQALQLCPTLKLLVPNYPLYHDLSYQLKILLQKETPHIEQFSIDEFFADISGYIKDEDALSFAKKLKDQIYTQIGIPVSIGIANTKWIAKLATNHAKPNGLKIVYKHEVDTYIQNIPIEDFPGIGKGYTKRLKGRGINTLGDIRHRRELFERWGINGLNIYNRALGIDKEKLAIETDKKSIGIGRTFDPINCRKEIKRRLLILSRHLCFLAFKAKCNPMSYYIKIRYQYGQKVKETMKTNRLFHEEYFKNSIIELFEQIDIHKSHNIIQLNISVSHFQNQNTDTINLLHCEEDLKKAKLTSAIQSLREKHGIDIFKSANELLIK